MFAVVGKQMQSRRVEKVCLGLYLGQSKLVVFCSTRDQTFFIPILLRVFM